MKFSERPKLLELGIFLARNLVLYFLFLHAYLYFSADLDLIFLSAGFVLSVLLAVLMERMDFRLWAAAVFWALALAGMRLLFFLVFRLQMAASPGPDADFLFFIFDKDFVPGLLPWTLVWLFNFVFLRHPRFAGWEAAFAALLLLAVFWPQGRFRITLYRHPSLLSYAAALFVVLTAALLVLAWARERDPEHRGSTLARAASFLWVLPPLLLLLVLLVLGRYNQGAVRLGGGLMKPTLFRFDFSQYIRLESEIEMSDDLVLLFRKQGPARRILLRRYILSGYDSKRGFFHIPGGQKGWRDLPVTVSDRAEEFADPGYRARRRIEQEFFFVNFDPTSLIGMDYPIRVAPLTNWDSSSFQRIYRVVSKVSEAGPAELASQSGQAASSASGSGAALSSHELEIYTDYGGKERIRELAEKIVEGTRRTDWEAGDGGTGGGGTPGGGQRLDRVMLIRDYLKNNYYYSLMPGLAPDGDQLSHFLYTSRKGYCSYFAFSMALLCRALEIPARVAVGFYVDPETEVLNFYEVRAYQAHAWVEVFFGDYGWIEFDPTSEVIAPGEEDTIRFGFDFKTFARLLEEILRNQHSLMELEPEPVGVQQRMRLLGGELMGGLRFIARLWYFTLPALYLLVISLIKCLPLLKAASAGDPRSAIKHLFVATRMRLEGLGLKKSGDESLLEYARRAESRLPLRLSAWVQAYLQAVFDEHFEAEQFARALDARRRFTASLRRCFSWPRRILGFLNPAALVDREPR